MEQKTIDKNTGKPLVPGLDIPGSKKNTLLTKDAVGKPKPTTQDIPANLAFGKKCASNEVPIENLLHFDEDDKRRNFMGKQKPKHLDGKMFGKDFKANEDIGAIIRYDDANSNEQQVHEYYLTRAEYLKMKKEESKIKSVRTNKAFDLMKGHVETIAKVEPTELKKNPKFIAVPSKIDNKRK